MVQTEAWLTATGLCMWTVLWDGVIWGFLLRHELLLQSAPPAGLGSMTRNKNHLLNKTEKHSLINMPSCKTNKCIQNIRWFYLAWCFHTFQPGPVWESFKAVDASVIRPDILTVHLLILRIGFYNVLLFDKNVNVIFVVRQVNCWQGK